MSHRTALWAWLAPAWFSLAWACGAAAPGARALPEPGDSRGFEGTWSAAGQRHTLDLGPERQASVVSLSGSLLLTVEGGLGVGFQARAITFSDSRTGSLGRFVWTDERGDQVFGELEGGAVATGRHVEGAITGGTGRYAGLSGKLEFEWQYVLETEDGLLQGRAVGLKGRVGRTEGTRREEGGAR